VSVLGEALLGMLPSGGGRFVCRCCCICCICRLCLCCCVLGLACCALLVGDSVADGAVPAGERVLAAGLVHSCLRPLLLPPSSRCCLPSFRSLGGAEVEALLEYGMVPDLLFFLLLCGYAASATLLAVVFVFYLALELNRKWWGSSAVTSRTPVRYCSTSPLMAIQGKHQQADPLPPKVH
jgi:hypothetical protein